MASKSRTIQSVNNTELYDRWAKVYDTDGNILQSIDDYMLPSLLNEAFSLLRNDKTLEITELGCGTGRNTAKLLSSASMPKHVSIGRINALDLSPGMLEVAKSRCAEAASLKTCDVEFHEFDALDLRKHQDVLERLGGRADVVISTLVLEHLPIDVFFSTVKQFLRPGGVVLITNMHSEMGNISQAGFVDEVTGEKIQGTSFAHTIEEVVKGAEQQGLRLAAGVTEKGIGESDIEEKIVGQRGRKWIGVKVWFGCVMCDPNN